MHCIYQLQKAGSYPPLTSWLLKLLITMLSILFCSCPCYSGLSNCWSFSDNAWSLLVQLLALAACQKTGFDLPECILSVWGGLTCITFLGLKSRLSWTRWLQTVLSVLETWNQQPRRWQDSALPETLQENLWLASSGFRWLWEFLDWYLPFHLSLLPCLQGSGSLSLNLVAARITVDKCFLKCPVMGGTYSSTVLEHIARFQAVGLGLLFQEAGGTTWNTTVD